MDIKGEKGQWILKESGQLKESKWGVKVKAKKAPAGSWLVTSSDVRCCGGEQYAAYTWNLLR